MNIAVISPASANCGTTTIASFYSTRIRGKGKENMFNTYKP